jgi:RHS repeat-associated protein
MKANLPAVIDRIVSSLLAGAALAVSSALTARAQVALDPQLAAMPVEQRITQAAVFTHPIVYVGDQPPDATESQDLSSAIDVMRLNGPGIGLPALELFVETYPDSVWTPSLRNNLAYHYRNKGRYTLALAHWATVWETMKLADAGRAKEVADFALAHLTRLLASLGRKETLELIFEETQGRVLDAGPLQQILEATKDGFVVMRNEPGVAYRCGTLALSHVARILQPGNANTLVPLLVPSPESGFSMSALQDLANHYRLNLVAVQRRSGQALVVPSVIHWQLDHYAAITDFDGKRYKVEDPTFERTIWMDAETINAEASGYFLVPANIGLPGSTGLTRAQTDQIFGRGLPYDMNNDYCESCPTGEEGDDGGDSSNPLTEGEAGDPSEGCNGECNGSGGPGDFECPNCEELADLAMPIWKIAEPYLHLWIVDKPMIYTKSYGQRHAFKMMYKQRNARLNSFGFGFGPFWECNRLAYFTQDSSGGLTHYVPGGGTRTYTGSQPEYKSGVHSAATTDGSGNVVSVALSLPNAAQNRYDYVFAHMDGTRDIYLTQQVDRWGRTNRFNYTTVNGKVHLVSVQDHNGRNTTFSYGNSSFPEAITQVTNPWNHTVVLRYDSSGRLTNIVDAASISSSFVYDGTTGWITNLVTPYGTTVFKLSGTSSNFFNEGTNTVNRSCTVTEPNGSRQLFVYRRNSELLNDSNATPLIPQIWPASEVPVLPYSNALDHDHVHGNNSFHWDRQQYAHLNATFRSSGNFNDLTVADYDLATLKHWLVSSDINTLAGTLSMRRQGSPDGTTRGQTVWYDYYGKTYAHAEGTNSRPSTIAWVLPNGQTHYTYFEYNDWSRPTLRVENYGDGSTSRTNRLFYDPNGLDLQYETGPKGEVLRGYSYNTNHQILTFTNAVGDVTTYNYDGLYRLYQRILPSGLTNNYTYGADGFVSQVTDQPINRTRSFTYVKSFPYTITDERGLAITNYWDDLQRLTGVVYPDGTISNVYSYLDITASKDRLGYWSYFGYNAIRQKIAETNANNVITRYGYCDCGALMYVTNAFGTSLQEVTSFGYDYQGNRTQTFLPDGTSVTYKFDSLKRITNVVDALSSTTNWFNNQGLVVAVRNGVGQVSATSYDIEDRATNIVDSNGVSINQTFDNLGRVLTRTYPDSGTEKFGYSARGLIAYTNQLNLPTRYVYDEASRKVAETNANNEVIKYTYNAASDLLSLVDGKNQTNKWNYDQYGRVTNKLDQANVEILRYKYDANSRLTNRWSLAKGDTKYTYDNIGNITLVDYPSVTADITLQYNALNRLTNMVDAAGTTKYTYYTGGLLNTEDGPFASDTVTYTYNNARLRSGLSLQQPTGTWTNGFLYDAVKRLTNLTSQAGAFAYSYAAGSEWPLVTGVTTNGFLRNDASAWVGFQFTVGAVPMTVSSLGRWVVSGNSGNHTVQLFTATGTAISSGSVTVSTAGQPAGQFAYAPLASPVTLAANTTYVLMSQETLSDDQWYDYGDTLVTLGGTASGAAAVWADINPPPINPAFGGGGMSYGPVNLKFAVGGASQLVRKLALPNTSYITNTYDNVARLTGTYLKNSGHTVLDQSEYLYNAGNQRIRLTRTDSSYYTNTYDNIGQLKWADSTVASEDRGYLYDAAWNLNVRTNNGSTSVFGVDNKNQLTTMPGGSCVYDSNGNLTSDPSRTLSYDAENQLIQVIYPASYRIDLTYDGQSRLRKRVEYSWNGTGWLLAGEDRYIYDGMRVIQERDGSNNPTVAYTRGVDLSGSMEGAGGIGGLLARSHGYSGGSWTTHHFYHADGVGNITAMVDTSQLISANYRYDPFGTLTSLSGSMSSVNMYRFSSKELLLYANLYYYGYRFYDPNLQRWLNRDPLASQMPQKSRLWGNKLRIEVEQSPNLYWPVRNDPINNTDPDGLWIWIPPLLVAAILTGCSKAPEPPPNDPYGCWASTDPKKLAKIPGQGAAKPIGCLGRQAGCFDCCEQNEPIRGGNPQKYAECISACEQNYRKCAGLSTSGPRR